MNYCDKTLVFNKEKKESLKVRIDPESSLVYFKK
jgi:hypothetical protein